ETAVPHAPADEARRQRAADDRQVERAVEIVVAASLGGVGAFRLNVAFQLVQYGLLRDVADGAAHGARTVQSALGPLQHLDAVAIDKAHVGLASTAVVRVGAGNDGFVVVDTDRCRPCRGDAADDVFLVSGTQVGVAQTRDLPGEFGEFNGALALQRVARDRL